MFGVKDVARVEPPTVYGANGDVPCRPCTRVGFYLRVYTSYILIL